MPNKTRVPLPIDVSIGLGSIANRSIGKMSFALSIKAPNNVSLLVRDVVFFIASGRPPRPVVVEHVRFQEAE